MKKQCVAGAILLLMLLSVGCKSSGNEKGTGAEGKKVDKSGTKHFAAEGTSFDYPKSWTSISEVFPNYQLREDKYLGAKEVTVVVNSESSSGNLKFTQSVRVEKKEMPPNEDLKTVFDQTYKAQQGKSFMSISEGTRTVGGSKAYEMIYRKPHGESWYQIKDVWLERDGAIFIISCWALPQDYAKSWKDFDMVISSFETK